MGIFITDGSLQVSKKLSGLTNARDFEKCKHIEIIVLAICWRLSAFKSPSHEKSIFLKIRSFFSFKFFQGHNWLTNYPDSEFHGHWKTVTLSSISPNLSKHWRFLAFWLSLCFGRFLLFLVCHDTAFLFSTREQWPRLADFRMLTINSWRGLEFRLESIWNNEWQINSLNRYSFLSSGTTCRKVKEFPFLINEGNNSAKNQNINSFS